MDRDNQFDDSWIKMIRSQKFQICCQWIADYLGPDVPLHFTAFHPDYKMFDRPHTPIETLQAAREIALSKGLHYALYR